MSDVDAIWQMMSFQVSPFWVALVQAAAAPIFLFGLVSGTLADLVDRRRLLIGAHLRRHGAEDFTAVARNCAAAGLPDGPPNSPTCGHLNLPHLS